MSVTWPRRVEMILNRINQWDRNELMLLENPHKNTNSYEVSGETNGLVAETKLLLESIGYKIKWNSVLKRYELDGKAPPSWNKPDWIVPKKENYAGTFWAEIRDSDEEDKRKGHGGSGKLCRAEIEIRKNSESLEATYRVRAIEDSNWTEARLSNLHIEGNQMASDPIEVKAAWPYYLPSRFEGRFVETKSLFFGGKLYQSKLQ